MKLKIIIKGILKSTDIQHAVFNQREIFLKMVSVTTRITDVKFESYRYVSNIAIGSAITDIAKGNTLEEAKMITE